MSTQFTTRLMRAGTIEVARTEAGEFVGQWVAPYGGTPYGIVAGEAIDYRDYMEWLYAAMGGHPKAWVEDIAAGVAYFLIGSETLLGYAQMGPDGSPSWEDAGITDDPDAWTDAETAFQMQARATLTEAAALAPALTERD